MSLPKYEAYKDSGASWELGRRSAAEGVSTRSVGTRPGSKGLHGSH